MMHPYAEGNVAAAQRDLDRCIADLKAAIAAKEPVCWRHVQTALMHAQNAAHRLRDAMTLETMSKEENAA